MRREHPSIPEDVRNGHVTETVFGTQRRTDREVKGNKNMMRNREGRKNYIDGGYLNCLTPTLLIILHISLCGGGFSRDGCLSAALTGITMTESLCFCLICREKRHRGTATDTNTDEVFRGGQAAL